jgi:hypothetical protein
MGPVKSCRLAAMVVVMTATLAPAQIIDRVLAVVGSELILLSDCTAATRFQLVEPAAGPDPIAAALPALIERQLQLAEVNRFQPPEPKPDAIDARLQAVRSRFSDRAAFESALAQSGLTEDRLRDLVRDNLRIESYRQQRFGATVQPAEDDIARYYRAHAAEFGKNGVVPSFEQARDEARRRLVAERSAMLIRNWVEGLRRRAEVTILYRTATPAAAPGAGTPSSAR